MNQQESLDTVVKKFKILVSLTLAFMILGALLTYKQLFHTFTFSIQGLWSIGIFTLCIAIASYICWQLIELLHAFGKADTFLLSNSQYLVKISNAFIWFALIESCLNHKTNPVQLLSNEHYGLSFGILTALLLRLSLFSKLFSLILLKAIEIKEDNDLTI